MLAIFVVTISITSVLGGTLCPPRSSIYPCSCVNAPIGRNMYFTAVTCHLLRDSDELGAIFTFLRSMEIDRFSLYDSFWEAHKLGESGNSKKGLPEGWLTLLKVKEMEIVDTPLSNDFACEKTSNCKNDVTTRFIAVNSSAIGEINPLCPTGKGNYYPWTGCMGNLSYFQFSHGKLKSFGVMFPKIMESLKEINLSYNQITTIKSNAIKNVPKLSKLDLSHNAIEHLDGLFDSSHPNMNLEFLDVSWNSIKALGVNLLKSLPHLKQFKADYNRIIYLKKEDWIRLPKTLKTINLENNPIHCGCTDMRWLKGHFPKNATLLGKCASPEEYKSSFLRTAANALNKKYDDNCNPLMKKTTTITNLFV